MQREAPRENRNFHHVQVYARDVPSREIAFKVMDQVEKDSPDTQKVDGLEQSSRFLMNIKQFLSSSAVQALPV